MPSEGLNRSGEGSAALAETTQIPLDRVKGTPVPIDGETLLVGKLSLNQILAIVRQLLSASSALSAAQREEIKDAGATSNVPALLGALDDRTVNNVFSVVLNRPEGWCGEHLDALSALEVADAVLEHNDWEELKAVFLRLRRRLSSAPKSSP